MIPFVLVSVSVSRYMIGLFETRDTRGTMEERGMFGGKGGEGDKAIVFSLFGLIVMCVRSGCICESRIMVEWVELCELCELSLG